MKRNLSLALCLLCLLAARAPAASTAAVRETEADARSAVRHGDYPTAVRIYEDCRTQIPDDPRLLAALGAAYFQNGQSDAGWSDSRPATATRTARWASSSIGKRMMPSVRCA